MRHALLVAALATLGCATAAPYRVSVPEPTAHTLEAKGCQGGCTLTRDPADALTPDKVHALLVKVAATEVGSESEPLNALLFHDEEARAYLATRSYPEGMSPEWQRWFSRELVRTTAFFSLRIVDEQGKERARVPETPMALGVKLHMQVNDGDRTGPFNANGTVVRVAPDRVWIRM